MAFMVYRCFLAGDACGRMSSAYVCELRQMVVVYSVEVRPEVPYYVKHVTPNIVVGIHFACLRARPQPRLGLYFPERRETV